MEKTEIKRILQSQEELKWHKKMTSTIPNAKANYIANIFAALFPKVFICPMRKGIRLW
jgi:hypothetical protein